MTLEEAIVRFRHAAIEKADFAEPAHKDDALYRQMDDAWRTIEEHGELGRQTFKNLLSDESRHVRGWVASQLLALGDEVGVATLEAEVLEGGIQGFDSEMVLTEWRNGRLKPPFGASNT